MDREYRPVWQTWALARPRAPAPAQEAGASVAERAEWRQTVQRARIGLRCSVAELASRVRCDVDTLAAFERGDGVLAADVQRRLKEALGL